MSSEQPNNASKHSHPYTAEHQASASPSPEQTSLLPSRLVFAWFDRFVWKGRRSKPLAKTDLLNLDTDLQSQPLSDEFQETWTTQGKYEASSYRLLRCLIHNFRSFFVLSGICHVVAEVCLQMTPSVLEFLLGIIERREQGIPRPNDELHGYLACFGIFGLLVMKTVLGNQGFFLAFRTGLKIRSSLSSAVYSHLLDLSSAARQVRNRVVTILSNLF